MNNQKIEFSSHAEYLQCAFNLVSKIVHHDAVLTMECSSSVKDHIDVLNFLSSLLIQMDYDVHFIDELEAELIRESGEFE